MSVAQALSLRQSPSFRAPAWPVTLPQKKSALRQFHRTTPDNLPRLPRRQFLRLAAGAAVLPAIAGPASAEPFPTRPVTMIVAFVAGGPVDVFGRIMATAMQQHLGQSVIVENVGGAAGDVRRGQCRLRCLLGTGTV